MKLGRALLFQEMFDPSRMEDLGVGEGWKQHPRDKRCLDSESKMRIRNQGRLLSEFKGLILVAYRQWSGQRHPYLDLLNSAI